MPGHRCNGCPTVLASYDAWLGGEAIAVDGSNVYWSAESIQGDSSNIAECPIEGCGGKPTPIGPTQVLQRVNYDASPRLAVDSTHVYWTDPGRATVVMAAK